ncbi:hypothetical protein NECAME_16843 [Necator americanus]|uniref:Uncharacterized protein n=1 Tax=Necator americanus TaxID=51031 RepID=W2TT28_NECAM|nr:hypothetical protein NECAME_16843 [Necator americanus]ETN85240.1 hypothetical protein NECAME_16843 [Necator americanus]
MFVIGFYALCVVCAILYYYTRTAVESNEDPNFRSFQVTYLTVYLLAAAIYDLKLLSFFFAWYFDEVTVHIEKLPVLVQYPDGKRLE